MYWELFLLLSIFAGFFLVLGYNYRTAIYVILGSIFLILIGFLAVVNGVYLPNGYNVDYDSFSIQEVQVDANTINSTINISNLSLDPKYESLDKETVYAKWLFGLLFIFVGAFVLFDAFFNNRFDRFV